ncbi:MAG: NADH-quinone oxidoreductase subunit NuoH [Chloroflexi bacterium]|nr:NADH-quinone oxidoreductase subunit NuoH [Chloroflexota bacterium]
MTVREALLLAGQLLGLLTALVVVVLSLIWLERKALARFQNRMGPMRVGFHGLLQPVADALKLLVKEDLVPTWADRALFWSAPLMVFVPSFVVWVTIPLAKEVVIRNLEMGLFYIVAFSILPVVGLVLAGWSSANKYAMLGSLRSAAQLVSYEIPIVMAVIALVMVPESLNLVTIVEGQRTVPYAALQPLGLALFLLAGVAEVGRTPFDIYFAESEVVGGPFVEYSGAHWSVFFLVEYINTFVVGVLVALLFLGGWTFPLVPEAAWLGFLWVVAKTYLVVLVMFWLRGTLPRLRVDQLMSFGWQLLVPLSFANIVITGFYKFYRWPGWTLTLMSLALLLLAGWLVYRRQTRPAAATAEEMLARARAYRRREA